MFSSLRTNLGRGYLLLFFVEFVAAVIMCIALLKNPGQTSYLLGWWQEFNAWLVPIVIGAKESGKVLRVFAGRVGKGLSEVAPTKPMEANNEN